MDQYLTIHAEQYTPVGEGSIPLGENAAVEGTPMDFRKAHKIGDEIEADFEQLRIPVFSDHASAISRILALLYPSVT